MNKAHWLTVLGIFLQSLVSAQTILQDIARTQYYPKMILERGETLSIPADTLMLDTLIMKEASTLHFLSNNTMLVVAHAFIGDHCRLSASGANGENGSSNSTHGGSGNNGRHLLVSIRFEELGALVVSTSGGHGGRGATSMDGGNGGVGGDGGNLGFYFLSPHFEIAIMEDRKQGVRFDTTGGTGGEGGRGTPAARGTYDAQHTPFGTMIVPVSPALSGGKNGLKGSDGHAGILRFSKIAQ